MNDDIAREAKRERSAYFKTWRAQNKDKISIYNERYWTKRAATRLQTHEADSRGGK